MALEKMTHYLMIALAGCMVVLSAAHGSKAEQVAARLYQTGDNITLIELDFSPPAPATVIVEMRLPPGVEIATAEPMFAKQTKNTIKWLLKNLKDSSFTIRLVTGTRLDLSSSAVHVRYRNPDSGTIQEIRARQ